MSAAMLAPLASLASGARALMVDLGVIAVHGTVLAALALALDRVGLRRPAWRAAVWLIVVGKLVLPWGPALPYSLADLAAGLTDHADHEAVAVAAVATRAGVSAAAPSAWWIALAALWALGGGVVLARAWRRASVVRRALAAAPSAPPAALAQLAALAARVGVRAPRLVVGEPTHGPHVVGLRRPTIVVPPALLASPALLGAALLHELAHVRRRDALGRAVQLVVAAGYFWWPPARWASRRLDLAREAACDAAALHAGELSAPRYARLLVQMARLRHGEALAMAGGSHLEARVAAALASPPRPRLGLGGGLALAAWIALALGGARTAAARGHAAACVYTATLAEALREAHPEADRDGDGVLSRDEACELQAELRRQTEGPRAPDAGATPITTSAGRDADRSLLAEPLCCNCQVGEGTSSLDLAVTTTCPEGIEGVDR